MITSKPPHKKEKWSSKKTEETWKRRILKINGMRRWDMFDILGCIVAAPRNQTYYLTTTAAPPPLGHRRQKMEESRGSTNKIMRTIRQCTVRQETTKSNCLLFWQPLSHGVWTAHPFETQNIAGLTPADQKTPNQKQISIDRDLQTFVPCLGFSVDISIRSVVWSQF